MNKENKNKLEALLRKVATERDLEIYGLNVQTNQNPIVIEIIIKKTNGDDISLDDCALFNTPAFDEIEKYKAWYWGRDERLTPKIIVKKPNNQLSFKNKTCYNNKKIKILTTNNFFERENNSLTTFGMSSIKICSRTSIHTTQSAFFFSIKPLAGSKVCTLCI